MKQILLTITVMLIISGCSSSKPVVDEPVKKNESVQREEIPNVTSEAPQDQLISSDNNKKILPEMMKYTISKMSVSEKTNGVLIQLNYTGDDPEENIKTFFSGDNFFNITFYKGKFSKTIKNIQYDKSVVKSVKYFEFKDSVQITLRLKSEYSSSNVSTDKESVFISVY